MITKFEQYNEGLNFDHKFVKHVFILAYNKAIKHFTKIHQSITEDHLHEFINQYMINNYGVDLPHSKEMYNYVKHLVHEKIKKK